MIIFIRWAILIAGFLFVAALFTISKEIFPPSFTAGAIRGGLAFGAIYLLWNLAKKIGTNETIKKPKFKNRQEYENWKSERLKKLSEKTSHVKAKPDVTIPMAIAEHEKSAITGKRALWVGGIATLIVASLITFQLFLRYQEAEVGFFDIKCDRVSGMVYIKHINTKEWRETKFKSLRHAKAVLSRRQIEDAVEDIGDKVEDIGDKVRDIEDKVDELQR